MISRAEEYGVEHTLEAMVMSPKYRQLAGGERHRREGRDGERDVARHRA